MYVENVVGLQGCVCWPSNDVESDFDFYFGFDFGFGFDFDFGFDFALAYGL